MKKIFTMFICTLMIFFFTVPVAFADSDNLLDWAGEDQKEEADSLGEAIEELVRGAVKAMIILASVGAGVIVAIKKSVKNKAAKKAIKAGAKAMEKATKKADEKSDKKTDTSSAPTKKTASSSVSNTTLENVSTTSVESSAVKNAPDKVALSEEEMKHKAYVDKLKEKYGCDDEKELKKAIMSEQIHNEKLGYIAQKDMAYADAALDTAQEAKKVADISADVIGELGGAEGKVFKNVYTGLTEAAEGVGQVISGRDAVEAITEAVIDTSTGIIQNEADGLLGKLGANTVGGGAKTFADTYMETDGDMDKAVEEMSKAVETGILNTAVDVVTDGLVDKAMNKAVVDAGKEAAEEVLKAGVNASKAFSQDLIKNYLGEDN